MDDKDQARPLAPSGYHPSSDDNEPAALDTKKSQRKKLINCCGCVTAILLIQAFIIIVLAVTVFKVKEPKITMNKVTVTHLELVNGSTTPKPGTNISLTADVPVKNPNVASFKYVSVKNPNVASFNISLTTTTLYYHGSVVREAKGSPGRARARRTMRMNITVDIITDKMIGNPNLKSDVESGLLTMSSYSRIPGRVNVLNVVKRHVVVKMNCTMTVNSRTKVQEEG